MKKPGLIVGGIILSVLVWFFIPWKSDREQAQSKIWICEGGYRLSDVIGFSDTLPGMYSIVGDDSIYKKDSLVAILKWVTSDELVIASPDGNEFGYYSPFQSIEKHIAGYKMMLIRNVELNKEAIQMELSGIVTTKYWMENGNLQVVLDSHYADFPNCFLDSPMDSLEVGDSMYKGKGENICQIFKKGGRRIEVRFIDPRDTIVRNK